MKTRYMFLEITWTFGLTWSVFAGYTLSFKYTAQLTNKINI